VATTDDRTTEGPHADRPAGRVSRRVVATGLAWSVPAVVVASAAPALAASGPAPLLQLVAPCVNPAGACAGRAGGFGFLVRVCGQGTQAAYLYSVTITSAQLGDLTFDSIEPPLGRAITPGNCTNTFFNARTATLPPAIFTATISVTWGHDPTIGADPDHPALVLQVPVAGDLQVCVCPPR
jgi:hypothetical protein